MPTLKILSSTMLLSCAILPAGGFAGSLAAHDQGLEAVVATADGVEQAREGRPTRRGFRYYRPAMLIGDPSGLTLSATSRREQRNQAPASALGEKSHPSPLQLSATVRRAQRGSRVDDPLLELASGSDW